MPLTAHSFPVNQRSDGKVLHGKIELTEMGRLWKREADFQWSVTTVAFLIRLISCVCFLVRY